MLKLLLLVALLGYVSSQNVTVHLKITSTRGSHWEGTFGYRPQELIYGWALKIHFNSPVDTIYQYDGDWLEKHSNNKDYLLVNKKTKGIHSAGELYEIKMRGTFEGEGPLTATGVFIDVTHNHQTLPHLHVTAHGQHTKYNYDDVLMKSILFYAAQRSGKLPADNPITWRYDSALDDGKDVGHDLTGGWYDAGDHVKFGFPMANTVTILAWGLIQWKDAYEAAGNLDRMYDCIKWPLDYFIKAQTGSNELYVQVGAGGPDHSYWGRPATMTMERPAFKIDASHPGSDVAGETAAAMAAGSIVFKHKDPSYSAKLLHHAKLLYQFALSHHGIYSHSVTDAASYYKSVAFEDELAWAGCWLYYATNNSKYLDDAEKQHNSIKGAGWGQSWDEKNTGANLLMYKFTGKSIYKQDIVDTFKDWMPGGKVPYTPKGMAFRLKWGALRYAQNMAMIALMAADYGIDADSYRKWAMSQVHYALGDAGRSYVIGFGVNPPTKPHHRSASCPMLPGHCDWEQQKTREPDPNILFGAMVGGPGSHDDYEDDRNDYVKNEVACDYNSGFQSAVAGLRHLSLVHKLPESH